MAIDRGPWNALVDDDGSNLVGSVWNKAAIQTVILDPTDAALVPLSPTYGTWTPVDGSGAALVYAYAAGTWARIGKIVFATFQVIYPSTSNGLAASVAGLPFASEAGAAGVQGLGVMQEWSIALGASKFAAINPTSGLERTNATLSGANIIVSAQYYTAAP